jgi:hypothetical protein
VAPGGFGAALGDVGRPVHGEVAGELEDLLFVVAQPAAQRVAGVVSVLPVPQPVVDDPEGGGLVVALAELVQQVRVQGSAAAGAGVTDGLVCLAQYGDDVAGPGLQAAGAELDDCPASPDYVLAALLDSGQPGEKVLVAGVAVGHQQPGERGRDARGDGGLAPRGEGLQPGQPAVRGPDDQHVRGTRSRLLLVFGVLFLLFPRS